MAEPITLERLKERRLDRMRLGQAVAEVFPVPSDEESRFHLVPLLESEYHHALNVAAAIAVPENEQGFLLRERAESAEILAFAIRQPGNLSERIFNNGSEVTEVLESQDINFLMDMYLEMVDRTSPTLDGLDDESLDALKKALREMNWNELSGKQWYAAKRLLLSIFPDLVRGRLHGFSSTNNLTTSSEESDSAPSA